jgi:hypothetical protein
MQNFVQDASNLSPGHFEHNPVTDICMWQSKIPKHDKLIENKFLAEF